MKPQTEWQRLIDEKIKISLVAHISLAGHCLGTISINPEKPKDPAGYDNVILEVFAGPISDDQMSVLRQLVQSYKFCLKKL